MAIADIHYEILDKCAPPQIRQQILGIVLCLEVPLFSFTMLVTELTHTLLYPRLDHKWVKISTISNGFWCQDYPIYFNFLRMIDKIIVGYSILLLKSGLTRNG
jgi:hypothetical protein